MTTPGKWVKGCESAHCVEVMVQKTQVKIRDSKDPAGPVLKFTREEFELFSDAIKRGVFE